MPLTAQILIGFIALQHIAFLVLEMFLWDKPLGMRIFRMSAEKAAVSKALAANQGLYNGFLAAGLIWALILGPEGRAIALFFLHCVLVAGIFGAVTVGKKILYVQALPAALGIVLVLFL
jgi:putative membrane protein